MGTAATATLTAGPKVGTFAVEAEFVLTLDTTNAAGMMTLDLTDYFSYIHSVTIGGELAATANGYIVKPNKPALATALTSTNLTLGFYEAGADGADLDLVASTDFSAVITGLTIHVIGKPALTTSWA